MGLTASAAVKCMASNLTVSRRKRKKDLFFFTVNREKGRLILTVKKFQGFQKM